MLFCFLFSLLQVEIKVSMKPCRSFVRLCKVQKKWNKFKVIFFNEASRIDDQHRSLHRHIFMWGRKNTNKYKMFPLKKETNLSNNEKRNLVKIYVKKILPDYSNLPKQPTYRSQIVSLEYCLWVKPWLLSLSLQVITNCNDEYKFWWQA